MQPYQEEYIANLKEIAALNERKNRQAGSFEEYFQGLLNDRRRAQKIISRNMELLRSRLFPLLDNLLDSSETELNELEEFAKALLDGKDELDGGLFCQIYQALLSRARLTKSRKEMIRHLYWLGIGFNNLCSKMVGLELADTEKYISQMRLCFTEAAAYLKYYDEIDDTETKGYILRSRANTALGKFKSASAKIRLTRQTLQILQDKSYQEKTPELPWERFIYMTHQQMASSISYNRDNDMTHQDVEALMESIHIVHQRRIQEAESKNETPPIKSAFSCCAIEYYCGLSSLEALLAKMETLMDSADTSDFTMESMYGIISLPAFYCQYLREYPEYMKGRQEYLEELYQKVLDYVEAFPEDKENEQIFFFLRQLSSTFVETENSISYGDFQQQLLRRFAPDIYVHSYVVGKTAAAFCGIIMDEEPDFFDDMEHIRSVKEPEEKRRQVVAYAEKCGLFHDVGKINFLSLCSKTSRPWFEIEYDILHLHTVAGSSRLSSCASTRHYAAIAHGHHSWYDGSRGYPESYKRLECPYRQMVDVIGLIDWIDNMLSSAWLKSGAENVFSRVIQDVVALEGKRFSPLLTARLREESTAGKLEQAFSQGRREAYRQIYEAAVAG